MPVCTKCKHAREIERLRRMCAACPGASANFGGLVHIDAAPSPSLVMRRVDAERLAASRSHVASRVAVADGETADLLLRVVAEFATLSDTEAPLVARRLRGQANWQIAHEMRLSKVVVYQRWTKLKRRNPLWAAIDNGLIGKRGGGRKRAKRGEDRGNG